MKRALLALCGVVLFAALPVAAASGAGSSKALGPHGLRSQARFVPGEVILGFRAQASRGAVARAHARVPARVATRFPDLRMELVKLSGGTSVHAALRAYRADPAVAFAEPNYLRYPAALPIPTDALFDELWGLNNTGQAHAVSDADGDDTADPGSGVADADIDAPEAWELEQGNGTVIAVIDTGIDVSQPDLASQLWTNPGETPANGLDDDGNGKIDDVHGWDFANGDSSLLSPVHWEGYEHGTHVSGTIAAERNDSGTGDGVVGVCPGCKIMMLKVARDADGSISIADEVKAINYAKSKGAKIANMSLGGPDWSNAEREALRLSGLLAVVAAGNESLDADMALVSDLDADGQGDIFSPAFPAAYTLPNVLSVAASNDEDRYGYSTECFQIVGLRPPCAFTNWGHDAIDVAAPGADITSTFPGSDWHTWDGTSMAAPHAAGVAGLVLSHHSTYTVAQVKNAIMNSVDKPTNLRTMYMAPAPQLTGSNGTTRTGAFTRTSGRINAAAALNASTANATPLTDGNVTGARAMTRSRVTGSVSWPADVNDVKKRKLYAGHTYRIKLVVPAGRDYDLVVWKPGTKEIWQQIWEGHPKLRAASARVGSADEVVTFKALSTGTYYIQVTAWLFKSGGYTLSIARLS